MPDQQFFKPKFSILQEPNKMAFVERQQCETDEEMVQLIPYVVMYDINQDAVLTYQRKAGDDRLLDYISIGVGGHINEIDGSAAGVLGTIQNNINRELREELGEGKHTPTYDWWNYFRGFIRDVQSEVNRVHLGLAFIFPKNLSPDFNFEDDEHIFKVEQFSNLINLEKDMELWSQIVYRAVLRKEKHPSYYNRELF